MVKNKNKKHLTAMVITLAQLWGDFWCLYILQFISLSDINIRKPKSTNLKID